MEDSVFQKTDAGAERREKPNPSLFVSQGGKNLYHGGKDEMKDTPAVKGESKIRQNTEIFLCKHLIRWFRATMVLFMKGIRG